MKTILATMLLVCMVGFVQAGTPTEQEARKNVSQTVKKMFTNEMNHYDNYFYRNEINKFDEYVQIIFTVDDYQNLSLVRVKGDSEDAIRYAKYVLANKRIRTNEVLVGKVFGVSVRIKYRAW